MSQNLDLKQIERKVYTSFHQDGLIDLFLGFIMLVSILSSMLDASGVSDTARIAIYAPLMVVLGPVLYMLGKKYISFPRMGYVKPGSKQKRKRRIIIFAIITAVLVTLVILTLILAKKSGDTPPPPGKFWSSLIMTLIIISIFSIIALVTMTPRFYLLGIIVGMSEPLYVLSQYYIDTKYVGFVAYGIPAIFLLLIGIIVLKRFIKKYPLPNADELNYQAN